MNPFRKVFFIICFFICISILLVVLWGYPWYVVWQKTYGGEIRGNGPYSICETVDGGYIVVGSIGSNRIEDRNIYILKVDKDGNKLWEKTYGGEYEDEAYSVSQTSDGGYIVAGYTQSTDVGGLYLLKLDKDGNKIMEIIDEESGDPFSPMKEASSVIETQDGGYLVAGWTLFSKVNQMELSRIIDSTFQPIAECDLILIKFDKKGKKVWERHYNKGDCERAFAVQETTDGGYIVAGVTGSTDAVAFDKEGEADVYVIKLDENGDKLWEKTYGGDNQDFAYDIEQTFDEGYIVAGETSSFGMGKEDCYIIKLDRNGNKMWENTYGGHTLDEAHSIQQTYDGGYIVGGYTFSFGAGGADFYIIKLDKEGNKIWEKTYGGTKEDWGRSIIQTSDGGYIMAGLTLSFKESFYVIKMDIHGNTGPYP